MFIEHSVDEEEECLDWYLRFIYRAKKSDMSKKFETRFKQNFEFIENWQNRDNY